MSRALKVSNIILPITFLLMSLAAIIHHSILMLSGDIVINDVGAIVMSNIVFYLFMFATLVVSIRNIATFISKNDGLSIGRTSQICLLNIFSLLVLTMLNDRVFFPWGNFDLASLGIPVVFSFVSMSMFVTLFKGNYYTDNKTFDGFIFLFGSIFQFYSLISFINQFGRGNVTAFEVGELVVLLGIIYYSVVLMCENAIKMKPTTKTTASATKAPRKTTITKKLEELDNLHKRGLLTDDEYNEKRKKYVDKL